MHQVENVWATTNKYMYFYYKCRLFLILPYTFLLVLAILKSFILYFRRTINNTVLVCWNRFTVVLITEEFAVNYSREGSFDPSKVSRSFRPPFQCFTKPFLSENLQALRLAGGPGSTAYTKPKQYRIHQAQTVH